RATVFRTLDLLVALGALSRIHGIEAGARCVRYTPCEPSHHHHLVCQACGRVEDLGAKTLERQIGATVRDRGFQPLGHSLEVVGICPECRK
ncbi:MAG TPA: transcriptional repressor, partial [Candidatus Limnocylindria bacterium]|nr:transcriptional repressor [Candidatus Limnocylindria bacterium]